MSNNTKTSKRGGFRHMTPEEHKRIAKRGGAAVPASKRTFSKNRELASAAGAKGGHSVDPAKRSFSINKELATEAGRKGGKMTQARNRRKTYD